MSTDAFADQPDSDSDDLDSPGQTSEGAIGEILTNDPEVVDEFDENDFDEDFDDDFEEEIEGEYELEDDQYGEDFDQEFGHLTPKPKDDVDVD